MPRLIRGTSARWNSSFKMAMCTPVRPRPPTSSGQWAQMRRASSSFCSHSRYAAICASEYRWSALSPPP